MGCVIGLFGFQREREEVKLVVREFVRFLSSSVRWG